MSADSPAALVTGGAVRVGRALVEALAAAGYRVVVHYNRSSGPAQALVAELRERGTEAVAIAADLSGDSSATRFATQAWSTFGRLDVLVNSASVFPSEPLLETDAGLWDHTLAVNLRAPFLLTREIGGRMKERGSGLIVNMLDLAGIDVWTGYAAHSVSKAGLLHLTRVAARALAPEVRVAGIAPGTVLPPAGTPAEEERRLAARAPLGRNGTPEDVARALLYLLEADFVTGEVLTVDGGRRLT
jgi:NAD(P)-dependent dehydrogenase (short-subunit alcohol dehydrogenase family)